MQSEKDNSFYIGSTSNIVDRLKRYNSGRSIYTRTRIPRKLVYKEKFSSKAEAVRRELQVKKWKSRKLIESLISGGP